MKKIILGTGLVLSLTGCITTSTLSPELRPSHWGTQLNESHNFYQISPNVFRSEQPIDALIPELEKSNISTIINLRSRNEDAEVFKHTSFNLVHIPINTWKLNRNDLLKVMQTIQEAQKNQQNVLIHCYHGSDRTGASIAMYRIIFENWSTEDALTEMKHGGYGFHPIWINIQKNFSPENIAWIKQQLNSTVN